MVSVCLSVCQLFVSLKLLIAFILPTHILRVKILDKFNCDLGVLTIL